MNAEKPNNVLADLEAKHGCTAPPLLAAVKEELAVLEKEIELMQLRVSECKDREMESVLRRFGSCLWRHKKAMERAIAANDRTERTEGEIA